MAETENKPEGTLTTKLVSPAGITTTVILGKQGPKGDSAEDDGLTHVILTKADW